MARGRFISKEISIDKKVNSLSSPWSILAFTWLLTHADREGRTHGDPVVVRSVIFPRQPSISIESMESFIAEWSEVGLINWYEVDGEKYIEFPNFGKHQVGLRKDKEPASSIPQPPEVDGKLTENIRNVGGTIPAEVKLREVKLREEEEKISTSFSYSPNQSMQFRDSETIILDRVFLSVTGFMPTKDIDRVRDAIKLIANREKMTISTANESAIANILRPYYLDYIGRKNKQGGKYSKYSVVWLLEWAVSGEIPINNKKPDRVEKVFRAVEHDPDCPLCHGKGKYMSEKSGRMVACDCVRVYEVVE